MFLQTQRWSFVRVSYTYYPHSTFSRPRRGLSPIAAARDSYPEEASVKSLYSNGVTDISGAAGRVRDSRGSSKTSLTVPCRGWNEGK
jgi:hypothetical protein